MTTEITHTEEISDNDLYIVKSREVNQIFSELSDVQKIEIQQRFDKAIVIAMKAQDLTAKIQFEKKVDEKQSEIQSKFEMIFLFFATSLRDEGQRILNRSLNLRSREYGFAGMTSDTDWELRIVRTQFFVDADITSRGLCGLGLNGHFYRDLTSSVFMRL